MGIPVAMMMDGASPMGGSPKSRRAKHLVVEYGIQTNIKYHLVDLLCILKSREQLQHKGEMLINIRLDLVRTSFDLLPIHLLLRILYHSTL